MRRVCRTQLPTAININFYITKMKMKINCTERNKFKTKESNENVVLIETKGLSMVVL